MKKKETEDKEPYKMGEEKRYLMQELNLICMCNVYMHHKIVYCYIIEQVFYS